MKTTITSKHLVLPIVDNPAAPDMFVDEAIGCYWVNEMLRITFASAKADHSSNPASKSRVVVGRLVMPLAAAENFQALLTTAISNMKSRGSTTAAETHTLQ